MKVPILKPFFLYENKNNYKNVDNQIRYYALQTITNKLHNTTSMYR